MRQEIPIGLQEGHMSKSAPCVAVRLDHLERSVRRLRLVTGALGLSLIGVFTAGFVGGQGRTIPEVRTSRLLVVDQAGTVRAWMLPLASALRCGTGSG